MKDNVADDPPATTMLLNPHSLVGLMLLPVAGSSSWNPARRLYRCHGDIDDEFKMNKYIYNVESLGTLGKMLSDVAVAVLAT